MLTVIVSEHINTCSNVASSCCAKVGVTEVESSLGLLLQPASFNVQVTDAVERDIQFTQFLTSVKGTVTCIGE